MQRHVVFMRLEELSGFQLEPGQIHTATDFGQRYRGFVTQLILEVGVDDDFLALLNQLDQGA